MQVTINFNIGLVIALVAGVAIGGGATYLKLSADQSRAIASAVAAATPAPLRCGSQSYLIAPGHVTDDITKLCKQLADLDQQQKTELPQLGEAGLSDRSRCTTSDGQFIGEVQVDRDKVDAFNTLCAKYQASFSQLPHPSVATAPSDTVPFPRDSVQVRNLKQQFNAEARALSPEAMEAMAKRRVRLQETAETARDLTSDIAAAGGGLAIAQAGGTAIMPRGAMAFTP